MELSLILLDYTVIGQEFYFGGRGGRFPTDFIYLFIFLLPLFFTW